MEASPAIDQRCPPARSLLPARRTSACAYAVLLEAVRDLTSLTLAALATGVRSLYLASARVPGERAWRQLPGPIRHASLSGAAFPLRLVKVALARLAQVFGRENTMT